CIIDVPALLELPGHISTIVVGFLVRLPIDLIHLVQLYTLQFLSFKLPVGREGLYCASSKNKLNDYGFSSRFILNTAFGFGRFFLLSIQRIFDEARVERRV